MTILLCFQTGKKKSWNCFRGDLMYKEIAAALFIRQETVSKHVYHVYEKLHVTNRVEAVNKYYGR